jgi:hypothetical protein
MNYKDTLISCLLCEENIQHVVDLIIKNFYINVSAIPKCRKIILKNINKCLGSIIAYPQNENELLEVIASVNKQCCMDFSIYLSNKYPNKNIYKTNSENSLALHQESSNPNVIILTEDEKNKLLDQYGMNSSQSNNSDRFLEYLTHPEVLRMFQIMINQLNMENSAPDLKVDAILTEEEVAELLKNPVPKKKSSKTKVPLKPPTPEISSESEDSLSEDDPKPIKIETETPKPLKSHKEKKTKFDHIDLSKPMTSEVLLKIETRVKQIVDLKSQYQNQRNSSNNSEIDNLISNLDIEKKQLIEAVTNYRKQNDKVSKESKDKLNNMSCEIRKEDEEPNSEYLDLELNPANDYNDLKNIIIKIKSESKISEIILINYYLPFNANNVNRFNNVFSIYMGERTYRINVPPANYSIQLLLSYLTSQFNFLNFHIDQESSLITISNTMNMKFDLVIGDGSIFPLLGFTGKSGFSQKDKVSYTGSSKYNIECNKQVSFVLSGTSMEPIQMEFDKKVEPNTVLKRVRSGFSLKQLVLRFTNTLEQFYDFIMPVNICLKITYIEKT